MAISTTYVNKGSLSVAWDGFPMGDYVNFKTYLPDYGFCEGGSCFEVFVKGGRVYWGNQYVDLADSGSIAVSGAHTYIWLQADDVTLNPPTITFENSPTGWATYPDDFSVPKKYWLLADVQCSANGVINIVDYWGGGDITWWVGNCLGENYANNLFLPCDAASTISLIAWDTETDPPEAIDAQVLMNNVDSTVIFNMETAEDQARISITDYTDDSYLSIQGGFEEVTVTDVCLIELDAVTSQKISITDETDNTYSSLQGGNLYVMVWENTDEFTAAGGNLSGYSDFPDTMTTDTSFGWKTLTWGDSSDPTYTAVLASDDIVLDGVTASITITENVGYDSGTGELWYTQRTMEFTNGLLTDAGSESAPYVIATAEDCPP